jgi:membrane protease YdiL (CAAX protease family)
MVGLSPIGTIHIRLNMMENCEHRNTMNQIFRQTDPPPIEVAPPPTRNTHWIFLGPSGLRAGWGLLLFAFIFYGTYSLLGWMLQPAFFALTHGAGHMDSLPLGLGFLLEGFQFACVLVPTVAMAFIERRSILSYGYQGRARALRFLSGLAWGLVAISAFVLVLWKAHLLSFDGRVLHGGAILKYALGWGLAFLLVGFFEESTMRGYVQYTFTRGVGFWWGALVLSFLFGFSHGPNAGESHVGLFSASAIGLIFCLSLWYTGSLWFAVGFHAGWDWGQSFFYGTADSGTVAQGHLFAEHPLGNPLWSGGLTGPEGSLLTLPLLALFALCMWLWWGRKGESPFRGAAWKPTPPSPQR